MKFYQDKEDVVWRFGRMFTRGTVVDITDRFTMEKLSQDPIFKEHKDEEEVQETATPIPVKKKGRGLCPKCGVKPNYYLHVKNCKGK